MKRDGHSHSLNSSVMPARLKKVLGIEETPPITLRFCPACGCMRHFRYDRRIFHCCCTVCGSRSIGHTAMTKMGLSEKVELSVGDELELECVSIGKKGDGILKKEAFVIIVPKTEKGKVYKIRITRVLPTLAFGEVV